MWYGRFLRRRPERIYMDLAAATPVRQAVLEAMAPYWSDAFGNPSAVHQEGVRTRRAVDEARAQVATTLKVRPEGVTFTGGGTESNNLALLGYLEACAAAGRPYTQMRVLTTAIEHPSVSEALAEAARRGAAVVTLPVDDVGRIVLSALGEAVTADTVLATFAYANSEVGTIQPVRKVVRTLRERATAVGAPLTIHLDAAQAPLWLPCELERLAVDLMSLDAGKCFGPKGVGIVVARGDVALAPVLFGGGQERGRRPGTENVPGIVGAAAALSLAQGNWQARAAATTPVCDHFFTAVAARLPEAVINGPVGSGRLPGNVNLSLPGVDTEYAVVVLDQAGVAASTKSACAGAGGGESAVVRALAGDAARARSTLRFTFGTEVTTADVDRVVGILRGFIDRQAGVAAS